MADKRMTLSQVNAASMARAILDIAFYASNESACSEDDLTQANAFLLAAAERRKDNSETYGLDAEVIKAFVQIVTHTRLQIAKINERKVG